MKLILAGAIVVAALIHLGMYASQESQNEHAPVGSEPIRRISLKWWPGAYIVAFIAVMLLVP